MIVRTVERRRSVRMPAAFPAMLLDNSGRTIAQGRTANISETGVFVITRFGGRDLLEGNNIIVQMSIPSASGDGLGRRTVVYSCHVVRTQMLGNLVGLGIEFYRKLA